MPSADTSKLRDQINAYYAAAVLGLRALDAAESSPRRFGEAADARWARFQGALNDGDRLEMLLRDAAAAWGVAFAAARVFQLNGVATDDPFGPAWSHHNSRQARGHLQTGGEASLAGCAAALGVQPAEVALPEIRPTTKLALAGGAAVLAAAGAFAGREDLDWAAQVTVVADDPGPRQLAGLAGLFVGAVRPCAVVGSDEYAPAPGVVSVISDDAEFTCRARLS